jgi:hypothetical protein
VNAGVVIGKPLEQGQINDVVSVDRQTQNLGIVEGSKIIRFSVDNLSTTRVLKFQAMKNCARAECTSNV